MVLTNPLQQKDSFLPISNKQQWWIYTEKNLEAQFSSFSCSFQENLTELTLSPPPAPTTLGWVPPHPEKSWTKQNWIQILEDFKRCGGNYFREFNTRTTFLFQYNFPSGFCLSDKTGCSLDQVKTFLLSLGRTSGLVNFLNTTNRER